MEALVHLAAARATVVLLPLKWVLPGLSTSEGEVQNAFRLSRKVGEAIARASKVTPWQSNCLAQALAGFWMLKRRGIVGQLCLGASQEDGSLIAHAWLQVDRHQVTGGDGAGYRLLAVFGADSSFRTPID